MDSSQFESHTRIYNEMDESEHQHVSGLYIADNESEKFTTLKDRRNFDSLPGIKMQSY